MSNIYLSAQGVGLILESIFPIVSIDCIGGGFDEEGALAFLSHSVGKAVESVFVGINVARIAPLFAPSLGSRDAVWIGVGAGTATAIAYMRNNAKGRVPNSGKLGALTNLVAKAINIAGVIHVLGARGFDVWVQCAAGLAFGLVSAMSASRLRE